MGAILEGRRKVRMADGDKVYFVRLLVFGRLWASRKVWKRASEAQVYGERLVVRMNRWMRKGFICRPEEWGRVTNPPVQEEVEGE